MTTCNFDFSGFRTPKAIFPECFRLRAKLEGKQDHAEQSWRGSVILFCLFSLLFRDRSLMGFAIYYEQNINFIASGCLLL